MFVPEAALTTIMLLIKKCSELIAMNRNYEFVI